jgi:hypothetical protein
MLVVVFKVGLSMMVVLLLLLKIVALEEMFLLLFKIEYGVVFVQRLYDR